MHKAIRSQRDGLNEVYSDMTAVDTAEWDDVARQEFKAEADVNTMLSRFGVISGQRPLVFGEVDFSIDLQQALAAIEDAKRVWKRMPQDIREAYPTWQALLNAANSGELRIHFEDPPPKPPVEVPAAP